MIYSTATVPVNPEGETTLTRAQVWAGLELKARDARLFLPPGLCTRCDVVEESATHFVREAIVNELFEGPDGTLQLRFYCYLGLRGREPNGPEEQAEQAQFDGETGYKAALMSTLKRTRELLAEGRL